MTARRDSWSVSDLVDALLRDSEDLVRAAEVELSKARQGDVVSARDCAEKMWNAIVQAVDALIVTLLGRRPRSHRERRECLWEIERGWRELEGIYDKYNARFYRLHGEMFYEGAVSLRDLEIEVQKAKSMIDTIRKFIAKVRS